MKFLKISLLLFIFINTQANFFTVNKKLLMTEVIAKAIQNIKSEFKKDYLIQAIIDKDIKKVKIYSKIQKLNDQPFTCSLNNQDFKEIFTKLNLIKEEENQATLILSILEKVEFTNTYLSLAIWNQILETTDKDKEISFNIIKELLNNGANINYYPEKSNNYSNGLSYTFFCKSSENSISAQVKVYFPLIFCVIDCTSCEVIELLFDHGANPRVGIGDLSFGNSFYSNIPTLLKAAENKNFKINIENRLMSNYNVDPKLIEEAKKYIIKVYNPLEVYIYGSYGLGSKDEEIDLNLLVITENNTDDNDNARNFLTELSYSYTKKCRYAGLCVVNKKDIEEYVKINPDFYRIQKYGKKIYSR